MTLDILDYGFMQRALLVALLVGTAAPLVGAFIVQRRLALIGDGIGHVALTGVAIGVLLGRAPVVTALIAAVAGAVAIELVRAQARTTGDVALAILFYGGIAGGVTIMSKAPAGSAANMNTYLFGAITTTSWRDVGVFAVLTVAIVTLAVIFGRELFAVSDDENFARASGLPVTAYNVMLGCLVATTVVVSMRVVGLLLVSALMVVPVATAQLLARSFRQTVLLAVALGLVTSVGGVTASYYGDVPSGGAIVLLAIALFAAAAVGVGGWRRVTTAPAAPAPTPPGTLPSPGWQREG